MILGLDPGLAITGYTVLEESDNKIKIIDCGIISTPPDKLIEERLLEISESLSDLLSKYKIKIASVEKLFFGKNVKTAINVAQSRGVMLSVLCKYKVKIFEYAPTQVKKAITGNGYADKSDVQEMVKKILNLQEIIKQDDAADSAALAICHYHCGQLNYV